MALTVPGFSSGGMRGGSSNLIPRAGTTTPAYQPKNYSGWTPQQVANRNKQLSFEIQRRQAKGEDPINYQQELKDLQAYSRTLNPSQPNAGTTGAVGTGGGMSGGDAGLIRSVGGDVSKNINGFVNGPSSGGSSGGGDVGSLLNDGTGKWKAVTDFVNNPSVSNGATPGVTDPGNTTVTNPNTSVTTNTGETSGTTATNPAPTPTYDSSMTQWLLGTLGSGINSLNAYEPKFFEGSPLYQFQKEQGQKDLAKLLASRGLTGSGAEIEGYSGFLKDLNATEAEKQRGYADTQMQRNQQAMQFIADYDAQRRKEFADQQSANADRKQTYDINDANIGQKELDRKVQDRQILSNLLSSILGVQAQSSPMSDIYAALRDKNGLDKATIDALTKFTSGNFQKTYPVLSAGSGGGGGGGGASAAGPAPVAPPDFTQIEIMKALNKYGNTADSNGILNTLLRSTIG